jgi:ABC-type antimicrobial peptide transport system permease subunit
MRDTAAPPQVVVNETFARKFLDGADPLGRRVEMRGRKYVITGVVRNSLYNAFGEPPTPILYFSLRDRPSISTEMHVRTRAGSETTIASELRRVVREIDPELPVYDIRTLSDHIEANLIFRRIPARMFMVLAPLLLVLAAIGIYAVVAYAVTLRRPEIGVRMALGARRGEIVRMMMASGARLSLIGIAAGVAVSLATSRILNGLMFGVERTDAVTYASVIVLMLVAALLACAIPAMRAARVNPLSAIRAE